MNYILGKIPRKKLLYKVTSSNDVAYKDIAFNNENYVNYSPDHNLDEECWFKIDSFSKQEFFLNFLIKEFDSKELDTLSREQFKHLQYLCSIQSNKEIFCFQKVTPSLFLERQSIIYIGDSAKLEEANNRILIKQEPDAVYFKNQDILIFKYLPVISSIFKGIDTLYKEATAQETTDFLSNSFIKLKDFDSTKVGKPNRKRIAMAMASLGKFDDNMKLQLFDYINNYCSSKLKFHKDELAFEISTDEELKFLLYGIEQRFYTTLLGNEKRLANSVIDIN
ncbi:hypothetical protein [Suttonella ornithocola]|uniref:ATP F0F1 synthase synthase n=1 Tax=Suttonella ornithocola TaxID=279832 RepID=A0A380MPQ9_9GAMM|nr:hypothetical protein [Suttonella ornithocola]SUO94046.1 Uncharacterised protein [Suttonella ornithocola]